MKPLFVSFVAFFALIASIVAYGPEGHQIVGAIADQRLANTDAGKKIYALIDGMTLEEAAIIPDTIKGWDKPGVDDPKVKRYYSSHPQIAEQLREFVRANPATTDPHSTVPSHHWFHYTDVPLARPVKYGDGKAGRSQWDIVHMMRFCTAVLEGTEPEDNPRKITKPVAVILLAHFVGDIHQPLHVGAEYFDQKGQPADPDEMPGTLPDEGGNSLTLKISTGIPSGARKAPSLHGYWDMEAVRSNLPSLPPEMPKAERQARMAAAQKGLADHLAKSEPQRWRLPGNLKLEDYPEAWADEILPLAREAHTRLRFESIRPTIDREETVASGNAVEQPSGDHVAYRDWAARAVRGELQKAGWRLADLLEKAVTRQGKEEAAKPAEAGAGIPEPSAD